MKKFQARLSYSDTSLSNEQVRQVYAAVLESRIPPMLKPKQIEPLIERARPAVTFTQLEAFGQVMAEYSRGEWEGLVAVPEPKK